MGKRGVSIVDIARMAGVSKTTVSNVLNGTGRASEETRSLILEIAEREGYVANFAAKSLRAAETKTVGIVTPDMSNEFFSSIIMRMERALYLQGYTSFVCDTESDPEREASYLHSLQQKRVDGIAFVNSTHVLELSAVPESIPVVVVDREHRGNHPQWVWVGNNVHQIAHDMTATLIQRGCRHIAFLNVSASDVPNDRSVRYLGYVEALAEAGVRLDHDLVLRGMHKRGSRLEAYSLVDQLLMSGNKVDGIVAMGDRVAIGAMEALVAHNLRVGADVRLIGCDDSLLARIISPSLSSVMRNVDELASCAAESLLSMMAGNVPASQEVIIAHEIIERGTTLG